MAFIRADIFSECLMRTVSIHAVIPSDKVLYDGNGKKEKKPFKTLYLLHGIFGSDMDWTVGTRLERFAKERNLAVIMPAGENHFYVDREIPGQKYGEFVGKELVELTRALFNLSDKREDTFIAGLSMGGYGALVNGLKYSDTFSHIGVLSGALVLDRVDTLRYQAQNITENKEYFEYIFGDLSKVPHSDRDYEELIVRLQKENREIPKLYMAIGTEDFLLESNRKYLKFLKERGVEVTYVEAPGNHEWDFWDRHIKEVIEWLPLEESSQGIGSGNVR